MKIDSAESSDTEDGPTPVPGGKRSEHPGQPARSGIDGGYTIRTDTGRDMGRPPPRPSSAPSRGWRQTFSSLKNRNFLFLWIGMIAMMGGMQMQMLARGYLVYDLTGSASLLGVVSAGSAVPMLTLALFGGAVADRVDRKRLIQIGQLIVACLALIVGLAITTGWVRWEHLLVASLIQGAVWSFMMPARQAIIPQLVGPHQIGNAMALNAAGMSTMTLSAPAIAGGLYALVGPETVYFTIAGFSLAAVVMTTFISHTERAAPARKRTMMRDIGAGLVYIRGNQMVLVLLIMGLATTLLASPFRSLLPVFVVDVYHRGPDSMGLLVAIMGGGSLAGSLTVAALGSWRRGLLLIAGAFASGTALVLVAIFPHYAAAAAIMLLGGTGRLGTAHD